MGFTLAVLAKFRISGEFEMKVYALRTCRGQWAVCSDEGMLLRFESYDQAIGTAVAVLPETPLRPPFTIADKLLAGDGVRRSR
jgi:hypothetical protein